MQPLQKPSLCSSSVQVPPDSNESWFCKEISHTSQSSVKYVQRQCLKKQEKGYLPPSPFVAFTYVQHILFRNNSIRSAVFSMDIRPWWTSVKARRFPGFGVSMGGGYIEFTPALYVCMPSVYVCTMYMPRNRKALKCTCVHMHYLITGSTSACL